jgi:hypothetical protein
MQWSTELPVAGSSFTYVMASLGQLPAFFVTSNMVCAIDLRLVQRLSILFQG